jgi:hypothetical protein
VRSAWDVAGVRASAVGGVGWWSEERVALIDIFLGQRIGRLAAIGSLVAVDRFLWLHIVRLRYQSTLLQRLLSLLAPELRLRPRCFLPCLSQAAQVALSSARVEIAQAFFVGTDIVDDVRDVLSDQELGFFGHQLERQSQKDILLWDLRNAANEHAADAVLTSQVRDDVGGEKKIPSADLRDGDWQIWR